MLDGGFLGISGGEVQMAPVRPRNKNSFNKIHEASVMSDGF